MVHTNIIAASVAYYEEKLSAFGCTARGVDWKDERSQHLRFEQLLRALGVRRSEPFSILDYGCGWGALLPFLAERDYVFEYTGYDPSARMIDAARHTHAATKAAFTTERAALPSADYVLASGLFNVRLHTSGDTWNDYMLAELAEIDARAVKGWAANFLTAYSDADRMRADLHYTDPSLVFDWCKRSASRWVSLLHDYELYEFTIGVLRRPVGER
jgi:Methyltransferase domain